MMDVAKLAHHWATGYPERKFEGDGLDDPLHAAIVLGQEWLRVRRELRRAIVADDFDYPGGPPEKCGVTCMVCGATGEDAGSVVHRPACPASDAFAIAGPQMTPPAGSGTR